MAKATSTTVKAHREIKRLRDTFPVNPSIISLFTTLHREAPRGERVSLSLIAGPEGDVWLVEWVSLEGRGLGVEGEKLEDVLWSVIKKRREEALRLKEDLKSKEIHKMSKKRGMSLYAKNS